MTNNENNLESASDHEMHQSMQHLEKALLSPVVSGELTEWVETVAQALREFGPAWVENIKNVVRPQYKQIARTDEDLLPRVEQMIQEEHQLQEDLVEFENMLSDLATRAEDVDNDELKAMNHKTRVERDGVALLIRIKKQEAAASTWLQEALYRDRGVVG